MKFGNPHTKQILLQADIQHSLSGGMALPQILLSKAESNWLLQIRVPGLYENRFELEVKDQILLVYYDLFYENKNSGEVEPIRLLAIAFPIPIDVEIDYLEAEFQGSTLDISMPRIDKRG